MKKRITVTIGWFNNYSALCTRKNLGTILATGDTIDKVKQNFMSAFQTHLSNLIEEEECPVFFKDNQYTIEWLYNESYILHEKSISSTIINEFKKQNKQKNYIINEMDNKH